jgi:kynurenine formamidase
MSRVRPPSADRVLRYFDELSNHGRWGEDDELGTLNHITPQARVAAARLVEHGLVVPLGMDLDPAEPDPLHRGTEVALEPIRYQMGRMTAARERFTLVAHGSLTHLDSPAHIGWDGRFYNGRSVDDTLGPAGAATMSVAAARHGIVGRGVLLDIAAARGTTWLDDGDGIYPEDILEAERRQGVTLRRGDIVVCRTGYLARMAAGGADDHYAGVGYHVSCLPLLHEREVAVIASDALNDMNPSGYALAEPATPAMFEHLDVATASLAFPVHAVALAAMGAWLLDHVEVEELAATCLRLGRWEFLLTIEPLRLRGATGSHVNPLAIF